MPVMAYSPIEQGRMLRDPALAKIAKGVGATPAQVALAWLLAQGDDIAPIPGTRRIPALEENVAADALVLSSEQLTALGELDAPAGDRYADMSPLTR